MATIQGHFDGHFVVLDEPASLAVGQIVQIVVVPASASADDSKPMPRRSLAGFAKGTFEVRDDFEEPLDEFAEYR